MTGRSPHGQRSSTPGPRTGLKRRRPAFAMALVVALLGPLVVVVDAAAAAPVSGPPVIGNHHDATPGGDLDSTTYGLARTSPRTPSTKVERPGWNSELDVPTGTQQVGLVWTGDPQAQFTVRTRASGAWSAPTDLSGELAEGPEANRGPPGAGPLWLGSSGVSRVQVKLVAGRVADVQLEAMTYTADPATADTGTRTTTDGIARPATPAGGPPIHLRSTWAPGGWASTNPDCGPVPKVNDALRQAIVHHTDGSNTYSQADVPAMLAGIYRFHTDGRGWCDIAYNVLIDRFGGVWEGRLGGLDNAAWGGHAQGFNTESVGVALLGQFEPGAAPPAVLPSAAMMTALRDVLAWKVGSQGLDAMGRALVTSGGNPRFPTGTIVDLPVIGGHRDTSYSSCPGESVYQRLPQMRVDVANRIAATNDPVRWRPHVTGARYWSQMIVDAEGSLTKQSKIGSYTSSVVRAGASQGDLTSGMVLSSVTDARVGMVDRLYRTGFGRSPDTAGMVTNVGHRDRAMSSRDLANNFLISTEFKRLYGVPDDAAFTALLFRNALGREATQNDLQHWTSRLAGGLARQDMLLQFSDSPEHRARVGVATRVTTAFFVMVRRVPSGASRAYWEPRLRAGVPNRDLVVGLLRSPDYLARF